MRSKIPTRKKPSKPYAGFPLFPHASGQWAKKIRGRMHYFGKWSDPNTALDAYLTAKDYLIAGIKPPPDSDGARLGAVAAAFLAFKQVCHEDGGISARTVEEYSVECQRLLKIAGEYVRMDHLTPDVLQKIRSELGRGVSPTTLSGRIARIRSLFHFAYDRGLIDRPIRYGGAFSKPSKRELRIERTQRTPRLFEPADIRLFLEEAKQPLKAMIYLGINCGFGNKDCGAVTKAAFKSRPGWVEFPRPKTGKMRRCPLWPETAEVIAEAVKHRPPAKDTQDDGQAFLTKYGKRWDKETSDNPVSQEFSKLLKRLGVHRRGVSFYALRHTFQTVGENAQDAAAVSYIMGHVEDDMASRYREKVFDERLLRVTDTVKAWLNEGRPNSDQAD